ncbi:hypothetical protein OXPF_41530 [Oxobacter pfennigii]|uniref:DUF58 domain-containing protein n=1 Tax=Oxobacter pfennigii TaxID=36849 RepID=A0A0N8NSL5_9CLOT|nr:DUF58 domain-containing protein [Oxobacter pfennigii]KPU42368.1 hypothetical protein OXPF_41530 [Oxobacter pfennigii]
MLKVNINFVLILGIFIAFALIEGGSLPYIACYGMLSIFLLSLLHIIVLKLLIFVQIKQDEKVKETGDSVKYTIIIKNKAFLPIPYITMENRGKSIGKENKSLIDDTAGNDITIESEIRIFTRGIYDIGNMNLKIMDIFRVFQIQKNVNLKAEIKIYPKIFNIINTDFKGSDGPRKFIDILKSSEDIYAIKDIQKYKPGDSLRRIHWKVSAKQGELYVKKPERVSGYRISVFLDMNRDNMKLDYKGLEEERIIDFCASLVNYLLINDIKVRIHVNASKPYEFDINTRESFNFFMEFLLMQKSDGTKKLEEFIYENLFKQDNQSASLVICHGIANSMASTLIKMYNSGYSIYVFYKSDHIETMQNISKLENSNIECFNSCEIIEGKNSTGGFVEEDVRESV